MNQQEYKIWMSNVDFTLTTFIENIISNGNRINAIIPMQYKQQVLNTEISNVMISAIIIFEPR